jgi:predicted RNase H-like HicB family nuclease
MGAATVAACDHASVLYCELEEGMLLKYLAAAMRQARYEILGDDGTYYGEVPGFAGVYANAPTLEACREELQQTLEDWLLVRIARHMDVPVVNGLELKVPEAV